MKSIEIRNLDDARTFVAQGLIFQRIIPPAPGSVRSVLEWALAICSEGEPLPPSGFVADVGHLALGLDTGRISRDSNPAGSWPHTLLRSYEDYLLGKFHSDWTFERASDALKRYSEKERPRGLAYIIRQIRERGQLGGVEFSPAVLRGLLQQTPEEVLALGSDSLLRDGPLPLLLEQYDSLIKASRRMAELLAPEDVTALEHRTALADMGQYIAHRQVIRTTDRLLARLPHRPVRPAPGRKEVPTRILDDDQYPVGGYSSISNRGSIESLLHSQLAYIDDPHQGPDLFDVKYVRDELFYYSRDENQFLRRRRWFAFILTPDLVTARFKDPELPTQRIVLVLAAIMSVIRRLTDWLSSDALHFEIVFLQGNTNAGARKAENLDLVHEFELLQLLLREWRERGAVTFQIFDTQTNNLEPYLSQLGKLHQLNGLTLSANPMALDPEGTVMHHWQIDGNMPRVTDDRGQPVAFHADEPLEGWVLAIEDLLARWI